MSDPLPPTESLPRTASMMNRVVASSLRQRFLAVLLTLVLVGAGTLSLERLPVDAYPDLHLKGRVTEILRATNSEFSLIPAEGVSGTFIKVTQRVPLRISVSAPPELALGPGLSVEVKIHSGSSKAAAPSSGTAHG